MSGPPFYRVQRARRTYHCHGGVPGCRTIEVGERYVVSTLPPGGEWGYQRWMRMRMCPACVRFFDVPDHITEAMAA